MDTTTPLPDVPLPAGAHLLSTWADWDYMNRVIWTRDFDVADVTVAGSAL